MYSARVVLSCFAALAFVVVGGGCSESTAPPKPASISPDQAASAEGTAGTILASPPTFVVKDASGNPLGGVKITIAITAGGGTLTDAPTSTNIGATPVGAWKLGNVAGVNSITVTAGGVTPLVITANGKAGPPASLAFISGSAQSARAGTSVPFSPVAQVRDQFGNGVAGAPVTFVVAEGGGAVTHSVVEANAAGNAAAPLWILGKSAVPQSLRASTVGGFEATVSATILSDYTVDIRFFGPPMPPVAGAMFTAAAARIRAVVVGDLPNVGFAGPTDLAAGCNVPGLPTDFNEVVDDILIYASVGPIDGAGKILAFAGPCGVRGNGGSVDRQTFVGSMKFDSDDLDFMISKGNLTDVIQHEMLHVVGIGTLWSVYGLLADAGTFRTRFTGIMGVGACIELGGATVCPTSVPVENQGGAGTADGHWRESTFDSELMTGFVETPAPGFTGILNPLSNISIESLADLGYSVNRAGADPYVIPGQAAARIPGMQLNVDEAAPWEVVMRPRFQVSREGRVSPIALQ